MVKKALVTISFGHDKHIYDSVFLPSMKAYAKKYNYDFICIDKPFDSSITNSVMGFRMQKLLVCSQIWSSDYDFIVCMDADIIINVDQAPDIIQGIPEGKIGAVCERKLYKLEFSKKVWQRWRPDLPQTGQEYYRKYGYPDEYENQFNSGVMVYQPKHHANFLLDLYNKNIQRIVHSKEPNDGDQDILSYHVQKNNLIHWLDDRWNMVWVLYKILFYPFLNMRDHKPLLRMALNNMHDLSYVVHMAGHVDWELLMP